MTPRVVMLQKRICQLKRGSLGIGTVPPGARLGHVSRFLFGERREAV